MRFCSCLWSMNQSRLAVRATWWVSQQQSVPPSGWTVISSLLCASCGGLGTSRGGLVRTGYGRSGPKQFWQIVSSRISGVRACMCVCVNTSLIRQTGRQMGWDEVATFNTFSSIKFPKFPFARPGKKVPLKTGSSGSPPLNDAGCRL